MVPPPGPATGLKGLFNFLAQRRHIRCHIIFIEKCIYFAILLYLLLIFALNNLSNYAHLEIQLLVRYVYYSISIQCTITQKGGHSAQNFDYFIKHFLISTLEINYILQECEPYCYVTDVECRIIKKTGRIVALIRYHS